MASIVHQSYKLYQHLHFYLNRKDKKVMQHLGGEVVTALACQAKWRATQSITI